MAYFFVASLVGVPSIWSAQGSHTLRVLVVACWIVSTLSGLFVIVFIRRAMRKQGMHYPPES